MTEEKKAVVSTKSGKLEGVYEDGLHKFRGIPYAEPPVGKLRWLPPQPVKPWDGIRPAKKYGAMAPQIAAAAPRDFPGAPDFGDVPQSEDCLYLNIWTPGLDDGKRPVFFWIHGGGFTIGSGSETFLDKGVLAQRGDIVMVSINYRLGAAGFLNLKEITGGAIPSTGNEGILDQAAALAWVQDNIARFGGNPDNITIAGFSAGGMSVGTLLALPAAKGRFCKAVNRSGAANMVGTPAEALAIAQEFLGIFGLKGNDIDGIRNLSTEKLLDGQTGVGELMRQRGKNPLVFQPIVDGVILPHKPMDAIRQGYARQVTVMAGTSRDELKSSSAGDPSLKNLDDDGLVKRLSASLPDTIIPGLITAYRKSLTDAGKPASAADIFSCIDTDALFRIPTLRLIEAQQQHGARAFNYLFTYPSPAMGGILGATHGLDNPFLFGALDREFTGNGEKQQKLAETIQDSCAAFMHTGNPSCRSAGEWPEYGNTRKTMVFDTDTRIEEDVFGEEREAWDKYTL